MLEHYFVRPTTIDRIRTSWLAPQIENYVSWMHENGYSPRSVIRRVPILCQFAEFARARGAVDVRQSVAHVEAFVAFRLAELDFPHKAPTARESILDSARSTVRQMLQLATTGEIKRDSQRKPFPFNDEARGFQAHLREERGLRESTLEQYAYALNRLERYLTQTGVRALSELSPPLLASFIIHTAPEFAPNCRRDLCGRLRVFLRYCHREGIIAENLAVAVEAPQSYRLAGIPRSITWDEVRRMLVIVDRRTILGRRDYAMLLLLVTYGLRAHEVVNLTLDDIDWKRERFQIPCRKAGHWTAYPLASVVADALIDYLKNGRPSTTDRHVFFRNVAPCLPISSAAISSGVAKYLSQAGIKIPRAGTHTLRHTCVQRLVDAEFPLKTIGDYVGHRCSSSTEIYSKVAIDTLREVAMGDGELL